MFGILHRCFIISHYFRQQEALKIALKFSFIVIAMQQSPAAITRLGFS